MDQGGGGIFSAPRIPTDINQIAQRIGSCYSPPNNRHRPPSNLETTPASVPPVIEDSKPTLLYGLPHNFNCDKSSGNDKRYMEVPGVVSKSPNEMKGWVPTRGLSAPSKTLEVAPTHSHPEEYLTEIPLNDSASDLEPSYQHTNINISSPFLLRTREFDSELSRTQPSLLSVDKLGSPADKEKAQKLQQLRGTVFLDEDDVVSEFLRAQNDPMAMKNLPNVEDGLSSGSELDTPQLECKTNVQSSKNHSEDIRLRSNQESPSVRHPAVDTLVSPPLVQDIWDIVHEIKQTLSAEKAELDLPADSDQTNLGVPNIAVSSSGCLLPHERTDNVVYNGQKKNSAQRSVESRPTTAPVSSVRLRNPPPRATDTW